MESTQEYKSEAALNDIHKKYSSDSSKMESLAHQLPRIPMDLRQNKLPIAIFWSITFFFSGILPVTLYFALRKGTNLDLIIVLAIPSAIFGALTLFNLGMRSWKLASANSTCRPLGGGRWGFDFFHINFFTSFIIISIILSVGIATTPSPASLPIFSLPLTFIILPVAVELLLTQLLVHFEARVPFRISSFAAGTLPPAATYVIAEDIGAVDGGGNSAFRTAMRERCDASSSLRSLFARLDLFWGFGGLGLVAVVWAIVLAVPNEDVGVAIGWLLPWIWAAVWAKATFVMTGKALEAERQDASC